MPVSYSSQCAHTRQLLKGVRFDELFNDPFRDVLVKNKTNVSKPLQKVVDDVIKALDADNRSLTLYQLYTTAPSTWPKTDAASQKARDYFILPYDETNINRTAIQQFLSTSDFLTELGTQDVYQFYKRPVKSLSAMELGLLQQAKSLWILRLFPRTNQFTQKGKCATYGSGGWSCRNATDTDECSLDDVTNEPLAGCDFC